MDREALIPGFIKMWVLFEYGKFMEPYWWFFILAAVLIVADCVFGIQRALYEKKKIDVSFLIKKTMNKAVSYVCWILLSIAAGKAIGEALDVTILPTLMLMVIYGREINSCYRNYFYAQGDKDTIVNFFDFFRRKKSTKNEE